MIGLASMPPLSFAPPKNGCSSPDEPRRRFVVIHNPVAGARRIQRLHDVVELLTGRFGAEVVVAPTAGRGDAEAIASGAGRESADVVVAAGGDGTINEVINGLAEAKRGVALGIIPLGTANVLAKELGLETDAERLAETLANGPVRDVCLGSVNGRRFAMMAGAGFDAHVVERVDPLLKHLTGKGAYLVETLAQLVRRDSPLYRVTIGERTWEAASVIVAKGRYYGGRFVCAPDANLFEPRLHVCLFPRGGRWNTLRYLWGVTAGRLKHFPDYRILPADRVILSGPEGEAVQADGDIIARLPAEIVLEPYRLPVVVEK